MIRWRLYLYRQHYGLVQSILAVVCSEIFSTGIPKREAKAFAIGIIYTNSRDKDDYRNMTEVLT